MEPRNWPTHVLLVASGVVPAVWAAVRAPLVPDASHALATVRAVGLGWAGGLRALDPVAASFGLLLPAGTRATRAALVAAVAVGLLGMVVFAIARKLLRAMSPASSPALAASLAFVAGTMTTLSLGAQVEAGALGATVLAAAIALGPIALLAPRVATVTLGYASFCVGLSLAQEPVLALMAMGSAAVIAVSTRPLPRRGAWAIGAGAVAGALPAAIGPMWRVMTPALGASVRPLDQWLGEGPSSDARTWIESELGWVALAAAAVGAVLALRDKRTRSVGAALTVAGAIGTLAVFAGAPAGPARWAASSIASIGVLAVLAAAGMQAAAIAIARIPVPFAGASSAMAVLLELAFPLKTADDTALALRDRGAATAAWIADTVLPIAPRALIVAGSRDAVHEWLALRAAGELGPDVLVVPTFDVRGRAGRRAMLREPALVPFARDMELTGTPAELSLTQIAERRPLLVAFEPRWNRTIAHHLVAEGLLDRFQTEPRGASERRSALRAFAPVCERLARLGKVDPALLATSTSLLRARALGAAVGGDREIVARALADLHRVAPGDWTAGELARRIVVAKGPIDVSHLEP